MSDKQLSLLIDNMAKALNARLQALIVARPELMQEVPAGFGDVVGYGLRGEKAPETVKRAVDELDALLQLVADWQEDARVLMG